MKGKTFVYFLKKFLTEIVLVIPGLLLLTGAFGGAARDFFGFYLSASSALLINNIKNEFLAFRSRKAYGSRIYTFNDFIYKHLCYVITEDNVFRDRYKKLLKRLIFQIEVLKEGEFAQKENNNEIKLIESNPSIICNQKLYLQKPIVALDGFVDKVFDINHTIDKIKFIRSRCNECTWRLQLEDIIEPYQSIFSKFFEVSPVWNELKPRIIDLKETHSDENVLVGVEPVSYHRIFSIHYCPDLPLSRHVTNRVTLRKILEPMLIDENGTLVSYKAYKDLPFPAGLGINMLLVACEDNSIILPIRSRQVAISSDVLSVSVAGSVDWKTIMAYNSKNEVTLRKVLEQEILEKTEVAPYPSEIFTIVPLAITRSLWTLGEVGFYTIGFSNISSENIGKNRGEAPIAVFGDFEEYRSFVAVKLQSLCNKEKNTTPLCDFLKRSNNINKTDVCISLLEILKTLERHVLFSRYIEKHNKKQPEPGVVLHVFYVALSTYIAKNCKDEISKYVNENCKNSNIFIENTLRNAELISKLRFVNSF